MRSIHILPLLLAVAPALPAVAGDHDAHIPGTYEAVHPHWRDKVIIDADGTYRRGNGDPGRWTFDGKVLVLGWKNWGPEVLEELEPGRYRARRYGFTLERRDRPSRPPVEEKPRSMTDAQFQGLMKALTATANELVRKDMALDMLDKQRITAQQFGKIIAKFNNELTRLEVVRERASRMIDPQDALGFASTFNNSLNAAEYVRIVSALE